MFNPADDIDAIQASLLRTLASAHRLRIIHRLGVGPCEVNEVSRDLGLTQVGLFFVALAREPREGTGTSSG